MTFDQIVAKAMDRLNLTSNDARTRCGDSLNEVYKDVTTSIGLAISRRIVVDVGLDASDSESILPDFVVEDIEKAIKVFYTPTDSSPKVLEEVTYDEVTLTAPATAIPTKWAVKRMGSGNVTLTINAFPEDNFTLSVEGYDIAEELADDAEPSFPVSFHNLLVEAVIGMELRKMEKPQLAQIAENKFEKRLSDLRMFIAKSAYLDIMQSKTKSKRFWQQ